MKEILYITIKGNIAFTRSTSIGDVTYLTDFNQEGRTPFLTFTSAQQVADWIEQKIKEKEAEPKVV